MQFQNATCRQRTFIAERLKGNTYLKSNNDFATFATYNERHRYR